MMAQTDGEVVINKKKSMHAILHYHGKILEISIPPPVTTNCNTFWNSPVFRNNMIRIMLQK